MNRCILVVSFLIGGSLRYLAKVFQLVKFTFIYCFFFYYMPRGAWIPLQVEIFRVKC